MWFDHKLCLTHVPDGGDGYDAAYPNEANFAGLAFVGQAIIGQVIDLSVIGPHWKGTPIRWFFQVTEAFAPTGTMTIDWRMKTASNEDLSDLANIPGMNADGIAAATLVPGYEFWTNSHFMPDTFERFVRLEFDINLVGPTAGRVLAGIMIDDQSNI